jgi:WD40 repeat protein
MRQLPQRTIATRQAATPADDDYPSDAATIEIPPAAPPTSSAETLATLELSLSMQGGAPPHEPRTIAFSAEQTVAFLGGSSALDDSALTSQWESNLAGPAPKDSRATIKQKDTVSGSFISGSSLIVKSRNVQATGVAQVRATSAAEAPDYELLNVIGDGGMGVVYAARQSSIARTVAVKMLKGDDSKNAHNREKFISEAVVTGELDHPNIVPIYDLGSNNDGALFYSMKRVKGTPWNKVLREKTLDENLTILLRAADAVAFAHVNGVIHRDLKPENVMLGDFGEVLVMDWGLARVSPEFPNAASVSQSDAMGGTPAYMAPEMATGPLDKITAASDVYLLGAILYDIITGKPPHTGKTVMACLFSAAKNQIEPTDHTGELLDVALKAMSTEPQDRYESVRSLQQAIRDYQAHSQSIQLVKHARLNLARAAENQQYELYARAIYGLEESLALWPANARAAELLSTSRLDYARLALAKGDFDLGASLLDPKEAAHRDVLDQLETGRRERESRQRRIKLLKGAVAALVASVIAIVSVAYAAVRTQRDEAVFQRDRAESEKTRAVKAEGEAKDNLVEAVAQRHRAEAETTRAVKAEDEAEVNLAEAIVQRGLAVEAKTAEEYAAYVARIGLTKAKIDENAFDRAADLLQQCPQELRDWEWGRLWYLCNMSERTWRNGVPVDAAEISPDGKHFATGDWAGKAAIWNLQTGQRELELSQGQYVHSVAYDASGERLAAGASDGSVHVYRASDGELIAKLDGHTEAVLSVRFSPDGAWLLSSGNDYTARLWNLTTGKTEQVLRGHNWWVWAAEFSPDGETIVTAGQDGKAIVWRRASAEAAAARGVRPGDFIEDGAFMQHRGPVYAASFSPDGTLVATAGYDGRVLAWRPADARAIDLGRRLDGLPDPPIDYAEMEGHRGPAMALEFSPDGRTLASGGQDNLVILSDVASGKALKQLRGHASHVRSCSFSPDGATLLTAGRDAQIKLWRPADYGEVRALAAPGGETPDAILCARFSSDGQRIVTAGRDRTASLWDAQSLERLQWFHEGHDFLASSAEFFADGTRLATGGGDGTVRLWDVATSAEIKRIDDTGTASALDVSDDGALIATGGPNNTVCIWNAASGDQLTRLEGHQADVTAVRFAPGGALLASGDERGHGRLWRFDEAERRWVAGPRLEGHSRTITALRFVDGARRLVSSSGDNTCGQWNVADGQEIRSGVLKHPDWIADLAVSADGRVALTCCDDGKIRLWSLSDARLLKTIEPRGEAAAFTSIDLSADGRWAAATCAAQGSVRLWDMATGKEIAAEDANGASRPWLDMDARGGLVWAARFSPDSARLLALGGNDARLYEVESRKLIVRFSPHGVLASADVSPDGSRVATGSWDRSVKIWDAATGKVIRKLDGIHDGYINSVCFSPDGSLLLTASDDGTAKLWNAADGTPREPVLRGHAGRVRQACFSPDGSRILTVSGDKTAKVSDAATGQVLLTLEGHAWAVFCGAYSADGQRIVTGSEDNTAIVWDASTGQRLQTLAGHTGAIASVAISPDGKRALTGSQDNAVKLWDAATGKEILTLAGHREEATSVAFAPDGRSVLTSGRDGQALLWPTLDWRAATQQR